MAADPVKTPDRTLPAGDWIARCIGAAIAWWRRDWSEIEAVIAWLFRGIQTGFHRERYLFASSYGTISSNVVSDHALAPGRREGAGSPESCDSPAGSGVLGTKAQTPVQSTEEAISAPIDFTTFMRNYQDMVYTTAVRLLGNDAQAEDISQEVFLKAFEHWENLSTSATAGGWLKTVTTNLSINHLQRYRKRWRFFSEFTRGGGEDEDEQPVEFASPDNFLEGIGQADRRAWVERALEKLPEHQRVPLVLFHFEDQPYDEIARRLGVSLSKVKTDILRGREALAKVLQHTGATHEKFEF